MSEKFKLKYEVAAILKENIELGLDSFGVPLLSSPGDGGWVVMEADQSSYQGADNAVIFSLENVERIGVQGDRRLYNKDTGVFDIVEYFIEQQLWKIKVICKNTTAKVEEGNIPLQDSDLVGMLMAWFNRMGCNEFRKHNMANLFISQKDVKSYQDRSDVPQWVSEIPLKLQVVKQFETEVETAEPMMMGAVPISGSVPGRAEDEVARRGVFSLKSVMAKIRGVFTSRQ